MTLVLQIIIGIFILGILVLIHELGHFTAAKVFGIRVLSFSIGFGKPLIKKIVGNTEYRISSIPFGGYVHMAGEYPDDKHEIADDEFTSKPIWQRASVAMAGPAANVISSIIFLWFVFIMGIPHELYLDNPTIGAVADSSAAFQAGLAPGDSVTSINNTPVHSWEDIQKHFLRRETIYNISFFRKDINKNTTIKMPPDKSRDLPKYLTAGLMPKYPAHIGRVDTGSPAEKSGIHPDDLIIAIDNVTIYSWFQVSEIVSGYNPFLGPLQIIIQRLDSIITISAEPSYNKEKNRFLLGIAVASPPTRTIRYNVAAHSQRH